MLGKFPPRRQFFLPLLHLLLALVLCLQLLALTQHHHSLDMHPDSCSACELGYHFSSGSTAVPPAVILLALLLVWITFRLPALTVSHTSKRRHLFPLPQAPPLF